MPVEVRIYGSGALERSARELKAAGDGRLTREMRRDMRTAARPLLETARRNALAISSQGVRGGGKHARASYGIGRSRRNTEAVRARAYRRSGLRSSAARATGIEVSSSPRSARVRMRTRQSLMPRDQRLLPAHLNTGRWQHPAFANRKVWVTQIATPPGWFDRAAEVEGPRVRQAGVDVAIRTIQKLAR